MTTRYKELGHRRGGKYSKDEDISLPPVIKDLPYARFYAGIFQNIALIFPATFKVNIIIIILQIICPCDRAIIQTKLLPSSKSLLFL